MVDGPVSDHDRAERGVSRRRFLIGAGLSVAAGTQLGSWRAAARAAQASRTAWADSPLGFGGGLPSLASESGVPAYRAFQLIASSNASTLRLPVHWDAVEASAGTYDWSLYQAVHRHAAWHGLKLLPVLVGAPSWLGEDEVSVAPVGLRYPTGSRALNRFGEFVVATLRYFSSVSECVDAVEIWSRPNDPQSGLIEDPSAFGRMVATAAQFTQAESAMSGRAIPYRVIAGGLALEAGVVDWHLYLQWVGRSAFPVIAGLHSAPAPSTSSTEIEFVEEFAERVVIALSSLARAASAEVWVTSTGISFDGPWGESGQAAALRALSERLSGVAECGGMIVNPLSKPDPLDGSGERDALLRADGSPRPALAALAASWVDAS